MVIIDWHFVVYALMWFFKSSVMTKLKKTLSPETKAVAPKWIEVKVSQLCTMRYCCLVKSWNYVMYTMFKCFPYVESRSNRLLWMWILHNALDLEHHNQRHKEWLVHGMHKLQCNWNWIFIFAVLTYNYEYLQWFANDTPLDIGIITTIRKKWATFFLKTAISQNG